MQEGIVLKIKTIMFAMSICTISTGLFVVAVGTLFLRRLDEHMYEHAVDFYDLAGRYSSITWAGGLVCLAGCLGLALALDYGKAFYVGIASACIALATGVFGPFFFPMMLQVQCISHL
jgi:hypothetical protein